METLEPKVTPIYAENLDPRTLRISVKNVKEWESPDGGGHSCKLYFDGKLVGDVYNDGNGGTSLVTIESPDARKAVYAYVDTLPWTAPNQFFAEGMKRDIDWVVVELIDWANCIKQYKRWNKQSVCFQVIPDAAPNLPQGDTWSSLKCPNPAQRDTIKDLVRKKHGIDGKKVIFTDDFC